MSELLGIGIVAISIIGLTYSISNIVFTLRKSSPELNSINDLIAYQQGVSKQSRSNV